MHFILFLRTFNIFSIFVIESMLFSFLRIQKNLRNNLAPKQEYVYLLLYILKERGKPHCDQELY